MTEQEAQYGKQSLSMSIVETYKRWEHLDELLNYFLSDQKWSTDWWKKSIYDLWQAVKQGQKLVTLLATQRQTLEQWKERASRGTIGDHQVGDILQDWERHLREAEASQNRGG